MHFPPPFGNFWTHLKCFDIYKHDEKMVFLNTTDEINIFFNSTLNRFQNDTLPKTNMSPENLWLEDVFPIEIVPF